MRMRFAIIAVLCCAALACALFSACSEPTPKSPSSNTTPKTESSVNDNEREYDMTPMAILVMEANGHQFSVSVAGTEAAEAFKEKLNPGALEMSLHDYGNFEKTGQLPWSLPASDERITTQPGDIMLYQGNAICIYYGENTWEFTKLGHIYNVSGDELLDILGDGDVTVRFWLEWTE